MLTIEMIAVASCVCYYESGSARRQTFQRKLMTSLNSHRKNNNCLLNAAYDFDPGTNKHYLAAIPGQKYKIDEQCSLLVGLGSKHCAVKSLVNISRILL